MHLSGCIYQTRIVREMTKRTSKLVERNMQHEKKYSLIAEPRDLMKIIERLKFTFTPNGKREFVPRDQVLTLFFFHSVLLLHKNK